MAREFFTVDLRGLRAALSRRAVQAGSTESDMLRSALAAALNDGTSAASKSPIPVDASASKHQVKLSVRIACSAALRLDRQARAAGLSRGTYLTGLIDGAPAVAASSDRRAGFAALSASAAELALVSRDISRLAPLPRSGEFLPAQEYQLRLVSLDADVRRHLDLATAALAELAPSRARARRVPFGPLTASGRRP